MNRLLKFTPLPISAAVLFSSNRNRTQKSQKLVHAKSKLNFDYGEFSASKNYLQEEVNEVKCVLEDGEVVCPDGLYRAYEGATEWRKYHNSSTKNDTLSVWGRTRDTGETEYRLVSHVSNLHWRDFLEVQLNIRLRKEWDTWVKELDVLECWEGNGESAAGESCAFRWVQKMPGGLLSPREYIYLREVFHDPENKTVTIIARELPGLEPDKKLVRVEKYRSCMIIKYDSEVDPGFTYVLTYHDDVSKILPKFFTKWANGTGARWSHDKILAKTVEVEKRRKGYTATFASEKKSPQAQP